MLNARVQPKSTRRAGCGRRRRSRVARAVPPPAHRATVLFVQGA